jgi:hypothetical protein
VLSVTLSYATAEKSQIVRGSVRHDSVGGHMLGCATSQPSEKPCRNLGNRTVTEAIFIDALKNFLMALQWNNGGKNRFGC